MKTVEIFSVSADTLSYYQGLFKYIMVDEYQDTNYAQYVLINLLAARHRNLCVVGDDWQGIYSWRGANIKNIVEFKKDYPEAVEIKLEQNYRSTQTILQASQSIIEKNEYRTDKILWTDNEQGANVVVCKAEDERYEGQFICHTIRAFRNGFNSCAVLYRTNAQSRAIEEAFLKAEIPYRIIKGLKFYERKEIKDVLAYLGLIVNPHDTINMLRVINVPPRRIGKLTIDRISDYSRAKNISFYQSLCQVEAIDGLAGTTRERLQHVREMLDNLRQNCIDKSPAFAINEILTLTGYGDYLQDGTEEGQERLENVREIFSVANKYDDQPGSVEAFLEQVALINDADSSDYSDEAVLLMTLHSAKGLEFDHVFLAGMEESIFPHQGNIYDSNRLEEERRLCYVGMTRAKKSLYLIHAAYRTLYGNIYNNSPSRYIKDIPSELVQFTKWPNLAFRKTNIVAKNLNQPHIQQKYKAEQDGLYKIGDKIRHSHFGTGTVVSIMDDIIKIAFPSNGIKRFSMDKAPIEKV
jgi:DNA helicase-2/ATP-dependent DNA helicase PcrA